MSPEEIDQGNPSLVRSHYAFMFGCIAKLHELKYGERTSAKAADAMSSVERLYADGFLSDYAHENAVRLFKEYQTLIPSAQRTLWLKDKKAEGERLRKLDANVDDLTAELCACIRDAIKEIDDGR